MPTSPGLLPNVLFPQNMLLLCNHSFFKLDAWSLSMSSLWICLDPIDPFCVPICHRLLVMHLSGYFESRHFLVEMPNHTSYFALKNSKRRIWPNSNRPFARREDRACGIADRWIGVKRAASSLIRDFETEQENRVTKEDLTLNTCRHDHWEDLSSGPA